jgi:hydrogenase-4 component E
MNPPIPTEISSHLIMLMAALMLIIQFLLVVQKMLLTSIRLFALQSLLLAGIAGMAAYSHSANHVYVVAVLTIIGKVLFLPWLLSRQVRRMGIVQEIEPLLNPPFSMLVCGSLTLLG